MADSRNSLTLLRSRRIVQFLFALAIWIFAFGYLYQIWTFGTRGSFDRILEEHFLATVGLPLAGMTAAGIVAIFKFQSGLIKFEGMGFKFSGASGQIILWIFCFLSIVGALKLLW